jgi:hypothetical protein
MILMEYTEYKILTAVTAKGLEKKVNQALADGWELVGGVAVQPGFMQAIAR